MEESDQKQLLNQLRDAHAIEIQALRQLERAARTSGEGDGVYREHLEQTKGHEQKLHELVEGHGHDPSPIEDKTLRGRAIGLRALADVALDTPVKTAMNLYALEHLEIATYRLLAEMARALDDWEVVQEAERILEEEQAAAEKLEGCFDRVIDLALGGARQGEEEESTDAGHARLLLAHLRDIHGLETQSLSLLRMGLEEVVEDDELEGIYREHLEQTQEQEKRVNDRIEGRDAKPSAVQDLHMGAATSGLRDLIAGQPDAHAKLAMNVFCVEHLEVAGYEFLARLAKQCGDDETVRLAEKTVEQERAAAQAVRDQFAHVAQLTLESDASRAGVRSAAAPE